MNSMGIMFHLADSSVLSTQDDRGFTPLMWAAAFGEKSMVDFLLEKVWKKMTLNRNSWYNFQ